MGNFRRQLYGVGIEHRHTMRKEELLNTDFLKQFKDAGELDSFLSELQKRGMGNWKTDKNKPQVQTPTDTPPQTNRAVAPDTILDGPWQDRRVILNPKTGEVIDTIIITQTQLRDLKADSDANIVIKKFWNE